MIIKIGRNDIMGFFKEKYHINDFKKMYSKANSLLKKRKADEAVKIYQDIINYNLGNDIEFTKIKIDSLWKIYDIYKNFNEEYAIYTLENLIKIKADKKAFKKIIEYYSKKDLKIQLNYAKAYRKSYPDDMDAYHSEISAFVKSKREKKAKQLCDLLETRIYKKKYPQYMDSLTEIYYDIFLDYDNALRISDDESRLKQPKTREFWYNRAKIMYKLSKNIEARRCIENALKKDATYFEALVFKGDLLYESGRLIGAREAYSYAMEVDPDSIEVQNYIYSLNKQIEQKLNFEKEIYEGVDFDRLEKEGLPIPENLGFFRKEKILEAIIDEDQKPFPDSNIYGISGLFNEISKIGKEKPILEEIRSLLLTEELEIALKKIDSKLSSGTMDIRLLYIKGIAYLMKGEIRKAQSIDDLFWQTSPKSISEELIQRDFNGIFVNIEDEMDYYNQKVNEICEGIIERRFTFEDFEPIDLNEQFIEQIFMFINSPSEDPFLSLVKPKIKKKEIEKIIKK